MQITTFATTSLWTMIFVVLKLCHVIDWSWWWVLAPAIASAVIAISLFLLDLFVMNRNN